MSPAERDEVRAIGEAVSRGCYGFDDAEARRWLQLLARAVMRYAPPGAVAAPAGFTLQPVAATADKPASVVTVSPKGRFWPLDAEMARQMGAAYMAAADAAEVGG